MPVICTCVTCGKVFSVWPAEVKRGGGKNCSVACQRKAQSAWMKSLPKDQKPNWKGGGIKRKCVTCKSTVMAKISQPTKRFCSNRCRNLWQLKTNRKKATKIELAVEALLTKHGFKYEAQYAFDNRYSCDFALTDKNIVIECDGDYWHSRPGVPEKDKRRDDYMTERGWTVYRFTETQIKTDIEGVENALLQLA